MSWLCSSKKEVSTDLDFVRYQNDRLQLINSEHEITIYKLRNDLYYSEEKVKQLEHDVLKWKQAALEMDQTTGITDLKERLEDTKESYQCLVKDYNDMVTSRNILSTELTSKSYELRKTEEEKKDLAKEIIYWKEKALAFEKLEK